MLYSVSCIWIDAVSSTILLYFSIKGPSNFFSVLRTAWIPLSSSRPLLFCLSLLMLLVVPQQRRSQTRVRIQRNLHRWLVLLDRRWPILTSANPSWDNPMSPSPLLKCLQIATSSHSRNPFAWIETISPPDCFVRPTHNKRCYAICNAHYIT